MSFILDAIARSEQERQQQQTPDARSLAFPAATPARSRRTAPYLIVGVLLLASAILAAVWIPSPRPPVTPFVGSGGSVPTTPGAAGQPPAPVESGVAPPAAPADTPEPVTTTPMLAESATAATPARAAPPVADDTVEASAAEPSPAAPEPGSPGESTPVDETGIAGSSLAGPEADAGARDTAAPPPESEAPRRRISRLSELPADVRRVLPSVVFTGHLYSRNPRASYVFIDGGRQVVAGQQITDDLLLDEITPTGVVVEFQGYLIEVGVLQNWSLK